MRNPSRAFCVLLRSLAQQTYCAILHGCAALLSADADNEPEIRRQLRAARLAERQSKMEAALLEKQAKVIRRDVGVCMGCLALAA